MKATTKKSPNAIADAAAATQAKAAVANNPNVGRVDPSRAGGGTDVAVAAGTSVGFALDFAADAGLGLENADKDSFAIPFLAILQSNSPQCLPVEEGGIEGARMGMLINSVTKELMKEARVVPVYFQRRYLAWALRTAGGGFKGEHSVADIESGRQPSALKEVNLGNGPVQLLMTPEGYMLKDTRIHYVLIVRDDGSWMPAMMSLSSTQIKRSKAWLSRIQNIIMKDVNGKSFNPPSFSHIYKLHCVREENDKGSWYSLDIDVDGPVADAELYAAARSFHSQVASGKVESAAPIDTDGVGSADRGGQF